MGITEANLIIDYFKVSVIVETNKLECESILKWWINSTKIGSFTDFLYFSWTPIRISLAYSHQQYLMLFQCFIQKISQIL